MNRVRTFYLFPYHPLTLFLDCAGAKLSGYTVDGTFAEYAVSYVNHVTPIPEGFPSDAAASILCAVRFLHPLVIFLLISYYFIGCHRLPRHQVQSN